MALCVGPFVSPYRLWSLGAHVHALQVMLKNKDKAASLKTPGDVGLHILSCF